jgi:hypothetical protein
VNPLALTRMRHKGRRRQIAISLIDPIQRRSKKVRLEAVPPTLCVSAIGKQTVKLFNGRIPFVELA